MQGSISISKVTQMGGGDEFKQYIKIEVQDETSGTRVISVELSLENFTKAITGSYGVDCEFISTTKYMGKVRQHKTENVRLPKYYGCTDEEISEALKPFEVDSWKAYRDDLKNSKRWVHEDDPHEGQLYEVTFTRYVDQV